MKTIVVFAALVAVAIAGVPKRRNAVAAASNDEIVVVNERLHDNIGIGGYQYSYELSDGSSRQETSEIEILGEEEAINRVTGSYRWVDPTDGQEYVVTYVADENGFRPQGAHLPTPPPAL